MSERPAVHIRQLINVLELESTWPKCDRFVDADYFTDVEPLLELADRKGHSRLSDFSRALVTVILNDDEPYEDYVVVDQDYTVGKDWPDVVSAGVWALIREYNRTHKSAGSEVE